MPMSPSAQPGEQRSLVGLGTAASLVVVTLRCWIGHHLGHPTTGPHWRGGLEAGGLGDADVTLFDMLLTTIAAGSRRGVHVHRPGCPHLGDDEVKLLRLLALHQRGEHDAAGAMARAWLHPDAAALASDLAASAARRLSAVGLALTAVAPIPPSPAVVANPGLRLLQ